ncbi:hypothetical protein PV05_10420 [Exophiala xenobiotica]|uniref:Methyltransferase type 11 domain-containing protein n=1 Tax=Exophiala xenobiotica TaxID=348802 RepID=A0A0D2BHH7_9EURO|nr:uncharacterized protein PV05_10420 [Exophiala xenobiotica]KIW51731.1 hypothetical protein PV05_10420 [Exophiala xenobiotica]
MANPEAGKHRYFTELAPKYSQFTGNTTRDLFNEVLDHRNGLSISSDSVVHDNAAGPGTAAEALITWCHKHNSAATPKIVVTDYVPAMIEACEAIRATKHQDDALWQSVALAVTDSADLKDYGDNYFTHSICNFSIFNLTHPDKCLQEMRRTLQPGGTAVVTCWKRFAAEDLLSAAQRVVKGDEWANAHRIPAAGPQYLEEGYTARLVQDAGFPSDTVETFALKKVVAEGGDDWRGLYEFLTTSSLKNAATREWSEEELAKWPDAVAAAMQKEKDSFGGLLFEAWVVIARK